MTAPGPLISVVICTRNRADLLQRAIDSVVAQEIARSAYELVIVDNGSSDRTPVVAQSCQSAAGLRYVREDRVGLCIARNTGWRVAIGSYVAFLDDDAIAEPGWLASIQHAFEYGAADLGIVGGRIDPIWEGQPPGWLSADVAGSLTIIDWGLEPKFIEDVRRVWLAGANMTVRRSVLEEIGGFHPWLDRVGSNLLSSGDVFLQKQALRRGYRCLYLPQMAVRHLVPTSRLTQAWFRRRYFWQGVSDAVMCVIEKGPSRKERLRLALARGVKVMRSSQKMAALLRRTDRPNIFRAKCLALIDIGFIMGLLGVARH